MMPRRYILILAAFALMVLLYVDRACISVPKDAVARDLGLSDPQMGRIFAAFSLGYALCQTPAGMLADRLGPRRVLTFIVAFWSVFTAVTAVAWSFGSMLIARFLFGCGEAGALPGVARAVYSWIPANERGLMQGVSFSGMRFGAAATLPLLGWMIGTLGWRPSFVILMVIGLGWAAAWYLWCRDDPTQKKGLPRQELEYILDHRQEGRLSNRHFGSFLTALAFPCLLQWTGGPAAFFYLGATLNLFAVGLWLLIRPDRKLEEW